MKRLQWNVGPVGLSHLECCDFLAVMNNLFDDYQHKYSKYLFIFKYEVKKGYF
jgi:hypothetical protein